VPAICKHVLSIQRPRRSFIFSFRELIVLLLVVSFLLPPAAALVPSVRAQGGVTFEVLWRRPLADGYWEFEGGTGKVFADTGDVDGDGIADVAVVPSDWQPEGGGTNNTVQVFKSDGTPLWSKSILIDTGRVGIADIDGDGKGEVVVFGATDGTADHTALIYALDDHDGHILWTWTGAELSADPKNIAFVNVDGDPEPEIIGANGGWYNRDVYALDNTDGREIWRKPYGRTEHLLVGDVTGDGMEEILHFACSERTVSVLDKTTGDVIWSFPTISYPDGVLGDIDGDGVKDVVVTCREKEIYEGNKLYSLRGGLDEYELFPSKDFAGGFENGALSAVLEDIDGDGIKDIIVRLVGSKILAYRNDGTPLWSKDYPSVLVGESSELQKYLYRFDVNRDGKGEIITFVRENVYQVSKNGDVSLVGILPFTDYWGFECGAATGKVDEEASTDSTWLVSGDMNDDGFEELVFYEVIDEQFYVTVVTTAAVGNQPPEQPMNASPADGATGLSLTPMLKSSDFSDPNSGDTHVASQWQIRTGTGDYPSPVFDSGRDTSNLTQIAIPSGELSYDTTYYWRVRHEDNHGAWSAWSSETSFVVAGTGSVSDGGTGISRVIIAAPVLVLLVLLVGGGLGYARRKKRKAEKVQREQARRQTAEQNEFNNLFGEMQTIIAKAIQKAIYAQDSMWLGALKILAGELSQLSYDFKAGRINYEDTMRRVRDLREQARVLSTQPPKAETKERPKPGEAYKVSDEDLCYFNLGVTRHADSYQILGVNRNATKEEVDKAYKAKISEWHPDRFRTERGRQIGNGVSKIINKARDDIYRKRGWGH